MENEYQLRLKDMNYNEKIKELTEKFIQVGWIALVGTRNNLNSVFCWSEFCGLCSFVNIAIASISFFVLAAVETSKSKTALSIALCANELLLFVGMFFIIVISTMHVQNLIGCTRS